MLTYYLLEFAKISASDNGIPTMDSNALLTNILNIVYFLAGAIAVIVIIVAGIMYTISSWDSGRVSRAKNLLTYALVGLVFVAFAFVITNFFIGRFK